MSTEKTHAERHPNDIPAPAGMKRVRVDGGGPKVKPEGRTYALVPAGHGEGVRCGHARRRASSPEPQQAYLVGRRAGMTRANRSSAA